MFTSLRMKIFTGVSHWRQGDLISLRDFNYRSDVWWQYPRALRAVATNTGVGNKEDVQSQSKSAARKSARTGASRDQRKASAATVIDIYEEHSQCLYCLARKRCTASAADIYPPSTCSRSHRDSSQAQNWSHWVSIQQSPVPCGRLA